MSNNSVVSYNAHISYIKDWNAFIRRMNVLRPTTIIAYIDDMKYKNKVLELQNALKDLGTIVVARIKDVARGVPFSEDGGYHLPGNDSGWRVSPRTFLDMYGDLGKNGLLLTALNEPDGYSNFDAIVRWMLELIDLADQRGIALALFNYGTGHPAESADEWPAVFDPVLERLSGHPRHVICVHEYLPGDGWRIGRILKLVRRYYRLKKLPCRMLITEWGVDEDHGGSVVNGYKSRGWSGNFYASTLMVRYDQFYRSLVDQGILIGMCVFCYGNSGGWEAFDVEQDMEFLDSIERMAPRVDLEKQPEPIFPPIPAPEDPRWKPALVDTGKVATDWSINLRSQPAITGTTIGEVRGKSIVRIVPAVKFGDWMPLQLGHLYGWVSINLLHVQLLELATGPAPIPVYPDLRVRLDDRQFALLRLSQYYVKVLEAFGAPDHLHMTTEAVLMKYIAEVTGVNLDSMDQNVPELVE